MFKALFGPTAAFVILVMAVVAPYGVLQAQGVAQPAVTAEPDQPVPAAPAAADDELSDDEIRQLLTEESKERFASWKKRRRYVTERDCSDYNGVDGPNKPNDVYCDPADIPAETIELYRQNIRQQGSTFVSEPQIKF